MTAMAADTGARRGGLRRSRQALCSSGTGCAGRDWLVTAPQIRPRFESVDRLPWGVYHLKENGSTVTACGQSAVTWHVFWGREIDPADLDACPECTRVAARHRQLVAWSGQA